MGKTKIEWCDYTVNPVIGCKNGCSYCYAKKLNDRFRFIEDFSKPQFFPERLKQTDKLHNKIIFMDSMSDIAFWDWEFQNKVWDYLNTNKTNHYMFLTKRPDIPRIASDCSNMWFGVSITNMCSKLKLLLYLKSNFFVMKKFISIEPILENIEFSKKDFEDINWVIIGAETGNRKGKVTPEKEWITNIVKRCRAQNIPVFMKNSLKEIMENEFIQEFPEEILLQK